MRKCFLLLLILGLSSLAHAQESLPPRGFFVALADVNLRIGQNIRLVCETPTDGSTCDMSDVRLNWGWELLQYGNAGLDCPEANIFYTQEVTSAYRYFFSWEGVGFEYRQLAFGGEAPFLCATSVSGSKREAVSAQAVANPSVIANPGEIIPTAAPTLPTVQTSVCNLPTRLVVNQPARITAGLPNNMRSQAGLSQPLVAQIPAETQIQILGGPVCADSINWWQVQFNTQIGWTGEGQNGDYWIEPLSTAPTATPTSLILNANRPAINSTNAAQLTPFTNLSATAPIVWSGYGLVAVGSNEISQNPILWVYDAGAGKPDPVRLDIGGIILDAAFNPFFDPNAPILAVLASINNNRVLEFWEPFLGQERFSVNVAADANLVAFSPDGKVVAVASGSVTNAPGTVHKVTLWNVQTGQPTGELAHDAYISAVAFSPDGKLLASTNGRQLILWDMTTLTRSDTLEANVNPFVNALDFSSDRKYLAVSSTETDASGALVRSYVGLWDVTTRTEVQQFPAEVPVNSLDFSPDSALLAVTQAGLQALTGSENTRVWNISTPETPAVILVPEVQMFVGNATFSDDGTFLTVYQEVINSNTRQVAIYTVPQ